MIHAKAQSEQRETMDRKFSIAPVRHCVKNPNDMSEPVTIKQLASKTQAKLTGDETIDGHGRKS